MFQFSENKEQMLAHKYAANTRSDRIPIQCRSDLLVDVANKLGKRAWKLKD
jgi:hypothetical protein